MQPSAFIAEINYALETAFNRLAKWFEAPSSLRAYRPASGGWAIDEILEHVALTNHYLLILIEKGAAKALKNVHSLNLEAELAVRCSEPNKLKEIANPQAFAWVRPEHMEPRGLKTGPEVAAALRQQLRACQQVLTRLPNGEGVLYRTTMTVNALGKIDVYDFVHFLAKHAERHLVQIQNVAAEYSATSH
ncbi:DinB family protein [Hymenobacter monticola]|uniref:DinB family protein n=1 Tax=Hymenobacter monticola TaxID=1705399 RepID=A0ABY4B4C1_9BACT|nr:DinB family protein [Hymenobacter monticola]UOE33699.1 DinB family protein [Hymenobacter monticola]